MKPNPFESLNHLTVPVVRIDLLLGVFLLCGGVRAFRTDRHNVLVNGASRWRPATRGYRDGTQKGLLAIRQAPNPFGTCPRAWRVCRIESKLAVGPPGRNSDPTPTAIDDHR